MLESYEHDLLKQEQNQKDYDCLLSQVRINAMIVADILKEVEKQYDESGFEFNEEEKRKFFEQVEEER